MKLRIMLTILAMTTTLLMAACTAEETPQTVDTDTTTTAGSASANATTTPTTGNTHTTAQTTQTTEAVTTTTEAVTTTTTEAPIQSTSTTTRFATVESGDQFTLTFPASWEGRYAVRENEDSVTFYELSNHHDSAQGKLFTFRFMTENPEDIGFPDYDLIGEYGGKYVVVLFPTDVQYSVELMDAYNNLFDQRYDVINTFAYID